MEKAAAAVEAGRSYGAVCRELGLARMTVTKYCEAKKRLGPGQLPNIGYRSATQVFTSAQEAKLESYILKAAQVYYGLGCPEVRKLAYQLTKSSGCKYPPSWDVVGQASQDWLASYMRRHPSGALHPKATGRKATSLARATSFNRTTVGRFFSNLSDVLGRGFTADRMWNVDETGLTTVQIPPCVIAGRGTKQVGAVTSAERGRLVTMALSVSAQVQRVPPMFVFPLKRYRPDFINGGPAGCIGSANGSGWMQEEDFVIFLQHFHHHTQPTPNSKVLLLLDNHASHVSLTCVEFAREHNIVLLSFPPHCSHKLQQLDRSVYGPLKRYINTAMSGWMLDHPGRTMTVYDLLGMVRVALPMAVTVENIVARFRCSGVWPYNPHIFTDRDYATSYVTDRPPPIPGSHGPRSSSRPVARPSGSRVPRSSCGTGRGISSCHRSACVAHCTHFSPGSCVPPAFGRHN